MKPSKANCENNDEGDKDILTEILDNDTKQFEAQAIYNVDEITEEEKAMTKWTVEDTDVSEAKGKEFMHVVRFFHKNDKRTACFDARTRWAFLAVGRDEMGDAFLHDKEKTNEVR